MKTHVLTLSKAFAKTHPRAGEPTNFERAFLYGVKKHTIRENYDFWQKRFEQIEAGEAQLSVRQWSGRPYASKQEVIRNLTRADGIGLEMIRRDLHGNAFLIGQDEAIKPARLVAANDGLTMEDFRQWFAGMQVGVPYALIYFNAFRYNRQQP